jgi:hypothetical protein
MNEDTTIRFEIYLMQIGQVNVQIVSLSMVH